MLFATAPKDMQLAEWLRPTSWPCESGHCPQGQFAVGDVCVSNLGLKRALLVPMAPRLGGHL